MKVTLAIAMRGIRGGQRDFFFFFWAVFLAVAAVTAMGTTAEFLRERMDQEARGMLAADLRLESASPFNDFINDNLRKPGWVIAENLEFSAMIRIPGSNRTVLVEVLAASPEHPLKGTLELVSGKSLNEALSGKGAVVEPSLQSRLELPVGGIFQLGEAEFQISDVFQREPDRMTRFFRWGPRLLIPKNRVEATGLLGFGSRMQYVTLIRLQPGEDPVRIAEELTSKAKNSTIRIMTPADSQPAVKRFIHRFTTFLGLVTLLTLLTTGNAMAGTMAALVREHRMQIAILKSLGASHFEVMGILTWRVLFFSVPASLGGAVAGMTLPFLLSGWSDAGFMTLFDHWSGLKIPLFGALLGILSGLFFSLGPLWGTRTIGPASLFRAVTWEGGMIFLNWKWRWGMPVAATIACAVFLGQQVDFRTGGIFAVELMMMLFLLWLVAKMGVILLQRLNPVNVSLRLAVRSLVACESGSIGTIVSVGLGLGLLCAILFLEQNLDMQMVSRLPQRIPSFFLVDLQSDQEPLLRELASRFIHDSQDVRTTPVIRGRIKSIKGIDVTQKWIATHPQSWRFTRDYVLTWSLDLPPGNQLIQGEWWRDSSVKEASVEREMARALGLAIGDELAFDIQGVTISARIASLREVHWSDFGLNFFVVFSPKVLEGAPFSYLGTVVVEPGREEAFRSAVVQRFHNVSVIASREVTETARGLLEQLIGSVRLAGATAVGAGLTALGVNVTLTHRRRAKEAAIRRLLGTTQKDLIRTFLLEYFLLGLIATVAGVVVGQGITAGVTLVLLNDLWDWLPVLTGVVLIMGVGLVGLTGLIAARQDLKRPVMEALRGHD